MEAIIFFVIIVFLFLVFGGKNKSTASNRRASSSNNATNLLSHQEIEQQAEIVAQKITTLAGVERLQERIDDAFSRVDELEDGSANSYNKALQKLQILEAALDIVEDKPFKYVFIPDSGIFTPKEALKEGYKVISEKKKSSIEADFPGIGYFEELGYNELEDEDPLGTVVSEEEIQAHSAILKLSTIVGGKAKHSTKVKNINKWVEEHESASYNDDIDWWYDSKDLTEQITPGDAYFIEALIDMGCPTSEYLYLAGFKEPRDYLTLDLGDFIKTDGVGPKTVERMKEFQDKLRSELSLETAE